ncbi:MAG: helix-turn-helix domain-containing protein [Kiloniellales bacterium]|nr:helix-turn-helix domain-containing protein [Kiloniellales bacterium]
MADDLDPTTGRPKPLTAGEEAAVRKVVQQQIIECLNRFYAIESGMWGRPINALILRTIIQGHLQDRLYDMSALAESLDLPLTTIHRKVQDLVEGGYVVRTKFGKSVHLAPTEQTRVAMDESFEEMICTIQRLYRGI